MPCYSDLKECPDSILSTVSDHGCDCPLDCSRITYSHSIQQKAWSPKKFCINLHKEKKNFILKAAWRMFPFNLNPQRDRRLDIHHLTSATQMCEYAALQGAKVTISYEKSTASRVVKLKRQTFAGMLSTLGKILLWAKIFFQTHSIF